jgi:O-antigen/teichoic acid export membrane protein
VIFLGTIIGQGTVFLATPLLARTFSPAEFGALSLVTTVSNIGLAASCLRFDLALPIARPEHRRMLFWLSALSVIFVTAIVAAGLQIARLLGEPVIEGLQNAAFLMPLVFAFAGLFQIATGWLTQQEQFLGIGMMRLALGTSFTLLAITQTMDLVSAFVWSFFVAALMVVPFAFRHLARQSDLGIAHESFGRTFRHYIQFPTSGLAGALLDIVGYSVLVWLITYYHDMAQTGQYAQILRVVGAPLMLVSMSLGQVLLRCCVALDSDREALMRFLVRILGYLSMAGVALIVLVAIVGSPVLGLLLGPGWRIDTAFILPITVAVTIRACVSPLSVALIAVQKLNYALAWQAAYFISAITLLHLLIQKLDFDAFLIAYMVHEIVSYALYLILIRRGVKS